MIEVVISYAWRDGEAAAWQRGVIASVMASITIEMVSALLQREHPNAYQLQDVNIFIGSQADFFRSIDLPYETTDIFDMTKAVRARNKRFAGLFEGIAFEAKSVPRDTRLKEPIRCEHCRFFHEKERYNPDGSYRRMKGDCQLPMPPARYGDDRERWIPETFYGCVLGEKDNDQDR